MKALSKNSAKSDLISQLQDALVNGDVISAWNEMSNDPWQWLWIGIDEAETIGIQRIIL